MLETLSFACRIILLNVCLYFFLGCAILQPVNRQPTDQELKNPLALDVLEEINDGNTLHVLASISSKVNLPASAVSISILSLTGGEIIKLESHKISELIGAVPNDLLEVGKSYQLQLSIPSQDMTSYQLELEWGQDSEMRNLASGSSFTSPNRPLVSFETTKIEEREPGCPQKPCPIFYTLYGQLENNTNKAVNRIELDAGYVWVAEGTKLDLEAPLTQNAEHLVLENLALQATGKRPVKIVLESGVPQIGGGKFQPLVKVLRAE